MRHIILAFLFLTVHAFVRAESHDDIAGKPDLVVDDASTLKKTVVLAALQQKHQEGKNLLWCSTLQLCWNELMKNEGGPVELPGAPELVKFLNEKLADDTQVDPAAVFTYVGTGPEVPKDLLAKLQKYFGGQASPKLIPQDVHALHTIFYSYLFRNLAFANQFDTGNGGLYFKGATVAQFGVWAHAKNRWQIAPQVHIHDYAGPDDFVIELKTTSEGDRLLLARVVPQETLHDTVKWALSRLGREPKSWLKEEESFIAPALNFEIAARFPELKGRILAPKATGASLVDAQQLIRFRLDEKGAVLKSEAVLDKKAESKGEPPKPRRFVLDGPFLILMQKKDAKVPYFAAWIDNDELLVPLKQPKPAREKRESKE